MRRETDIGSRVALLRMACDISQAELARRLGVCPAAISKLEAGRTRMVRADHLLLLAAIFRTDPIALLFGEDSDEYRQIAEALASISQTGKPLVDKALNGLRP